MRGNNPTGRKWFVGTGSLRWLTASAILSTATVLAADGPGVWQQHQLRFNYLGVTPTYSCEGLKDNLQALLRESGAGPQMSVVPGPCVNGYATPEKLIYANLKFSTLMPASGDTGSADVTSGSWHPVTISPRNISLQGGNCELVEEFRDKVLPLFATRNVKSNLNCIPFQSTGYQFSLSFEVFAPAALKLPSGNTIP
jgi:hypothetical protein